MRAVSLSQAWATILADAYTRLGLDPSAPEKDDHPEMKGGDVWTFFAKDDEIEVVVDGSNVTVVSDGRDHEVLAWHLHAEVEASILEMDEDDRQAEMEP